MGFIALLLRKIPLVSTKGIINRRKHRQTVSHGDVLQQSRVLRGFEFVCETRSSYDTQRSSHQWTQLASAGVGRPTEVGYAIGGSRPKVKSPRALSGSILPLGSVGEGLSFQQVGHCSGMY